MTPSPNRQRPFDLDALRKRLNEQHGKTYWRSLNELAESDEFIDHLKHEFPRQASLLNMLNRRDFLKVLGASLALAGLTACVPQEASKILPYSNPPEELIPGKPLYFASVMPKDGYGLGVLVKSDYGRPIKVDGNPRHPVSQGSSDLFMQASILDLYDPDRSQKITQAGIAKTWSDFTGALAAQTAPNLRILTGQVTSPSLAAAIQSVLSRFPQAKWHQYSPLSLTRNNLAQVFGQPLEVQYHFDKARVILSLDADFLFREPGSLRYGQDFGAYRQPNQPMSRLYVVESSLSLTGSNADHRLAVRSGDIEAFARALANRLGVKVAAPSGNYPGQAWIEPLAADLQLAKEASLVIAGERQPAIVHALAHAINQALGAAGNTLTYTDPVVSNPVDQVSSINELAQDLSNGTVDTLLILEGNPAYTAPAELNFPELIKKAKFSAYLGLYADETAALTTWHIPAAHYLEAWGDLRAYDGTTSVIQPLIEPLYGGKSALEVLAVLQGQANANGYDLLRAFWQGQLKDSHFDNTWRQALNDGFFSGTAQAAKTSLPTVSPALLSAPASPQPAAGVLELVFEPDPTIWDGQYTNNAWLQELPKPLTKLTWDNALLVSPKTAQRLDLSETEMVQVSLHGRTLEAPIFIQPGQADDSLALSLGYGRKAGGKVLEGAGFNAYAIRTSTTPWFDGTVEISKTGKTYQLVTTRDHQTMEGRNLVREATLAEYQQKPNFAQTEEARPPSLYDPVAYPGHAWGMAINLNTCIGCNACVLSCQAENNIPTVGKDQVYRSREMHWLRIDRYFKGNLDTPSVVFEPVPCMQCEDAPCEPVCPVEATSHSSEGINQMTYNRCVGTRYCSNNCPYKVRRFNFYKYADDTTPSFTAMRNPDVSVRMRGVMEKCNYCIQRVIAARIQSEVSGQPIKDGSLLTACQQACPTHAIVFGDLNDTSSQVRQLKETPRNYALLGELGTRPRTTYLARVTNPNPQMKEQA